MRNNNTTQPATRKTTRRKRRSPEEILERILLAAGEEFGEQGYNNATTAGIARRADVTEAQLFRYFRSKAELFREAILKPLDQRLAEFNDRYLTVAGDAGNFQEQARAYITELQKFIREHWKMIMSLVVAQAYAPESLRGVSEMDSLHTYFKRNAELMSERQSETASVDPRLMVRVSFAAVLANVMFEDWLFPRGLAGEEEINTSIVEFVMFGIGATQDIGGPDSPAPG